VPQLLVQKGLDVTAMDISPTCVEMMQASQPQVVWCCADAFALPESWSRSYDLVVDKGLLGHIAAEDVHNIQCGKLLAEYGRVLREGGQVILVSLAPLLSLKSPEVHSHWDQEVILERPANCVTYILSKKKSAETTKRPGWISNIEICPQEVLMKIALSDEERQTLELHTNSSMAMITRPDTNEAFVIQLSKPCFSAKWTRGGLKLNLDPETSVGAVVPW